MEQRESDRPISDFEFLEKNAIDSPVEDIKWYGKKDQTEETLLHDTGKGDKLIIRLFEFKFPPTLETLPSKEQLLTEDYIKYLHRTLWGDDLRIADEKAIQVSVDKSGCKIFVPCYTRAGSTIIEEPKLLQEWITTHNSE